MNKISKILYLILIIGLITISFLVFLQRKLPAEKITKTFPPSTFSPSTSSEIQKNTQSITPSTTSQNQIDTSDWETYRNDDFKFEIKYPPELLNLKRTYSSLNIVAGINFKLPKEQSSIPGESMMFIARRFFRDYQPDECLPPKFYNEIIIQTQKEISGIIFTRIETKPPSGLKIIYIGKYDDICYRFYFDPRGNYSEEDIARFENIVDTFRILK